MKLHYICAITLSFLFLYSGVQKMNDLNAFYESVLSFQIVHGFTAKATVYIIPPLEIICAIGLLIPSLKKGASLILSLLLIFFTLLIVDAWMRGIDVDCGCFGTSDTGFNAAKAIARDIAMFAGTAWIFINSGKSD